MARTKNTRTKPVKLEQMTPDERLAYDRQTALNDGLSRATHTPEPSYLFQPGDVVGYGGFSKSTVEEVLYDGKGYLLLCEYNNQSREYKDGLRQTYRLAPWLSVRPIPCGTTNFARNQDVRLTFCNGTLESMLHRTYFFGVNMDPEYQRGYVWNDDDVTALLDSVFGNIDIGKFVYIQYTAEEWAEKGMSYEILDGKQRLRALTQFYENRFQYRGAYFNDLSAADRRIFMEHRIVYADVRDVDKATVYRYFLMLNTGGRPMDPAQLQRVEMLYQGAVTGSDTGKE